MRSQPDFTRLPEEGPQLLLVTLVILKSSLFIDRQIPEWLCHQAIRRNAYRAAWGHGVHSPVRRTVRRSGMRQKAGDVLLVEFMDASPTDQFGKTRGPKQAIVPPVVIERAYAGIIAR